MDIQTKPKYPLLVANIHLTYPKIRDIQYKCVLNQVLDVNIITCSMKAIDNVHHQVNSELSNKK